MALYVPVNGVWKHNVLWVPVGNTWRQAPQVYVPVNGTWRAVYGYYWEVGGWGGCSVACGGGTQYRSVRCKRVQDGVHWGDNVCTGFGAGAKPATSQPCNTHSCTEYRYDGCNYWAFDGGQHYQTGDQIFWDCVEIYRYYHSMYVNPWPIQIGGYLYQKGDQQWISPCYCGPWGGKYYSKGTIIRTPV